MDMLKPALDPAAMDPMMSDNVLRPVGEVDPARTPEASFENEEIDDPKVQQLVLVASEFIHGKGAQAIEKQLNNPNMPIQMVVGQTAAQLLQMVSQTAQAAKDPVDDWDIQAAFPQIVEQLMEIGEASGSFGDVSDEQYEDLMNEALLVANKVYGQGRLDTGQAPRGDARRSMEIEMRREAENGELDDWEPPVDQINTIMNMSQNRDKRGP